MKPAAQAAKCALNSGFQLHIPKPIHPAGLIEAVASLMASAKG